MAVVVLEGWAEVPAIGCFAVPGRAMGWAVVHEYFAAGWSNGVAVVIKVTMKVLVGGQLWVQS